MRTLLTSDHSHGPALALALSLSLLLGCSPGLLSGPGQPDGAVAGPDLPRAPPAPDSRPAPAPSPDSLVPPPPDATVYPDLPPLPDVTGPTSNLDSARGEALASAAKQGQAGGSLGRCWEYVWKALISSGVATNPGGDKLGLAGPCSLSQFNASAYCFGKNAASNPTLLYQTFRMEQLSVAPTSAPRGAVIVWDRGCNGYSSTHGHIEVAQGDGSACSDFCGTIASGGTSCAWVFAPVL